jgi:hypothetical protein
MALPNITLQMPSGTTVPSDVILQDGTKIKPNSSGQIVVASNYLAAMLAGGWQIVTSGSSTHIP